MLLEGDEVEVQVLDAVLLEQILPDQTVEVDASFSQRPVLVERRVTLDRAEVPTVIAHVQRLLLVVSERVAAQSVGNAPADAAVACSRIIIDPVGQARSLEHFCRCVLL